MQKRAPTERRALSAGDTGEIGQRKPNVVPIGTKGDAA